MLTAYIMGWGIPLTPVMLLLINVLGDGIPGLRLAHEQSDARIMKRKPVGRDENFLGDGLLWVILQQTAAFSVVGLAAYYCGAYIQMSNMVPTHIIGQTMAFLVVAFTSIVHIFTVRSRKSIRHTPIHYNMPLLYSALAMLVLFASMALLPPLQFIFGLTAIGGMHWLIVAGLTTIPTIVAEIVKYISNRHDATAHRQRLIHHETRERI